MEMEDKESTITLVASYALGTHLEASLYYNSASWHELLRQAIDSLLAAFATAHALPRSSTSLDVELSPFQLFKRIWFSEGWGNLHKYGAGDARGRPVWMDSIYKGFLRHLHETEEPVYQLAALFGLYAFYSTQDRALTRIRIPIDPPTLDHLISLPESLTDLVDFRPTINPSSPSTSSTIRLITSESSTLQIVPSLDMTYIIHALLAHEVFFIIPSESFLFPPSPQVVLKDPKAGAKEEARKLRIKLEEESQRIRKAEIRPTTSSKGFTSLEYEDDPNVDWTSHLSTLESAYNKRKTTGLGSLISDPLGSFQHHYAKNLIDEAKAKTLGYMRHMQADGAEDEGSALADSLMSGGTDFLGLIGDGLREYEEIIKSLDGDLEVVDEPRNEMELDG